MRMIAERFVEDPFYSWDASRYMNEEREKQNSEDQEFYQSGPFRRICNKHEELKYWFSRGVLERRDEGGISIAYMFVPQALTDLNI